MSRILKTRPRVARQIGKHAVGCRAWHAFATGQWDTVWGTLDRDLFTTRSLKIPDKGRGRGVTVYCLMFKCNAIDCPARLVVRADSIFHAFRRHGVTGTR